MGIRRLDVILMACLSDFNKIPIISYFYLKIKLQQDGPHSLTNEDQWGNPINKFRFI